jgi:hypothetical protein
VTTLGRLLLLVVAVEGPRSDAHDALVVLVVADPCRGAAITGAGVDATTAPTANS